MKKQKLVIISLFTLIAIGSGGIFAYSKYFQPKPKEDVKGETVAVEEKVEPYRCPDGTVSPKDGGVFNWGGSTECAPDPNYISPLCYSDSNYFKNSLNCPDTISEPDPQETDPFVSKPNTNTTTPYSNQTPYDGLYGNNPRSNEPQPAEKDDSFDRAAYCLELRNQRNNATYGVKSSITQTQDKIYNLMDDIRGRTQGSFVTESQIQAMYAQEKAVLEAQLRSLKNELNSLEAQYPVC